MIINRELIDDALQAVRGAGEIILKAWDKPRNIRHKGRIDLVTDTDVAVEDSLKKSLGRILPEADFLAEESAGETELKDGPTWIVDPLDGTTNFAHRIPFVAVSVGLWQGGAVRMGIVHLPVLGEMYWAAQDQGAFLNGEQINVTETQDLVQALVATGFPYTIKTDVDQVLGYMRRALMNTRGVRRCGSAATDLAFTAAGRFDSFFEIGLKPWDTAAGACLIREAGGMVSTMDGQDYFPGQETILGTNKVLHEQMIKILGA
ncbi:inositol monophosphatase family protein [Desulfonatronospira sp. MSAO_Bac3]|uniref:inositol monophosphatase family protein n=1 Tax=Desulfonatronospira sp. MSAO_Bac3 TaxID=2293857 RepID=UPI000FF56C0A|nr:inositol monophosphatase family protein [Desulfonatronospira sp. MSAO_Bac3]RQD77100.1 MAG: inositol monophosphatase [Desulfonatronospira sp. MSAO_Bac3]